jgi:hypothetical protein
VTDLEKGDAHGESEKACSVNAVRLKEKSAASIEGICDV